jgi:hypothetical protein
MVEEEVAADQNPESEGEDEPEKEDEDYAPSSGSNEDEDEDEDENDVENSDNEEEGEGEGEDEEEEEEEEETQEIILSQDPAPVTRKRKIKPLKHKSKSVKFDPATLGGAKGGILKKLNKKKSTKIGAATKKLLSARKKTKTKIVYINVPSKPTDGSGSQTKKKIKKKAKKEKETRPSQKGDEKDGDEKKKEAEKKNYEVQHHVTEQSCLDFSTKGLQFDKGAHYLGDGYYVQVSSNNPNTKVKDINENAISFNSVVFDYNLNKMFLRSFES